jgi:hypothetical protein
MSQEERRKCAEEAGGGKAREAKQQAGHRDRQQPVPGGRPGLSRRYIKLDKERACPVSIEVTFR